MSATGRLERVDPRDVWNSETGDFAEWLADAENLALLGEELGISLKPDTDTDLSGSGVVCCDGAGAPVLIEPRLDPSDDAHLGHLLTQAAQVGAATAIWISPTIADVHQTACAWLNTVAGGKLRVFALGMELWRIANSPAAVQFTVVIKPEGAGQAPLAEPKPVQETLSPVDQMQRNYWSAVRERLSTQDGALKLVTPPEQAELAFDIGKPGVVVNMAMSSRERWVRAEILLTGGSAKADFSALMVVRKDIESMLGYRLEWQEGSDGEARVNIALKGADPAQRNDWTRQHDWLVSHAAALHRVFAPHVAKFPRSGAAPTEAAE